MYVAALKLGFSHQDLKEMPLNRLLWFITQHNLMNSGKPQAGGNQEAVIEGNDKMMKRFVS